MAKQIYKMKCPHCGWIRKIEMDIEAHHGDIIAGIGDFLKNVSRDWQEKIKELNQDGRPQDDWLRMPPCSNCGKPYDYNVKTRETRKPNGQAA